MAEITAALVKELREKTGAGMMDCKRALGETARRPRRRRRLAAQEGPRRRRQEGRPRRRRRAGRRRRRAATCGALVEVNAETDFVARNEQFQDFVRQRRRAGARRRRRYRALEGRALSRQRAASVGRGADAPHRHHRREHDAAPRRAGSRSRTGVVVSYVHNAAGAGPRQDRRAGRRSNRPATHGKLAALGKQLAMHVAAANPQSLDIASVDRRRSSASATCCASRRAPRGKPDDDHREDGRGPAAQVLRGGRAARAGLSSSTARAGSRQVVDGGGQGGRRPDRGRPASSASPSARASSASRRTSPPRSAAQLGS